MEVAFKLLHKGVQMEIQMLLVFIVMFWGKPVPECSLYPNGFTAQKNH